MRFRARSVPDSASTVCLSRVSQCLPLTQVPGRRTVCNSRHGLGPIEPESGPALNYDGGCWWAADLGEMRSVGCAPASDLARGPVSCRGDPRSCCGGDQETVPCQRSARFTQLLSAIQTHVPLRRRPTDGPSPRPLPQPRTAPQVTWRGDPFRREQRAKPRLGSEMRGRGSQRQALQVSSGTQLPLPLCPLLAFYPAPLRTLFVRLLTPVAVKWARD